MSRTPSKARTWKCQRVTNRVKCGHVNPRIRTICLKCGKKRGQFKKAAHLVALDKSYEFYIEINGGEHCGICGKTRAQTPKPERKLDRDHDHITHQPRGLLCRDCNRKLKRWANESWLWAALAYLRRARNRNET